MGGLISAVGGSVGVACVAPQLDFRLQTVSELTDLIHSPYVCQTIIARHITSHHHMKCLTMFVSSFYFDIDLITQHTDCYLLRFGYR